MAEDPRLTSEELIERKVPPYGLAPPKWKVTLEQIRAIPVVQK